MHCGSACVFCLCMHASLLCTGRSGDRLIMHRATLHHLGCCLWVVFAQTITLQSQPSLVTVTAITRQSSHHPPVTAITRPYEITLYLGVLHKHKPKALHSSEEEQQLHQPPHDITTAPRLRQTNPARQITRSIKIPRSICVSRVRICLPRSKHLFANRATAYLPHSCSANLHRRSRSLPSTIQPWLSFSPPSSTSAR